MTVVAIYDDGDVEIETYAASANDVELETTVDIFYLGNLREPVNKEQLNDMSVSAGHDSSKKLRTKIDDEQLVQTGDLLTISINHRIKKNLVLHESSSTVLDGGDTIVATTVAYFADDDIELEWSAASNRDRSVIVQVELFVVPSAEEQSQLSRSCGESGSGALVGAWQEKIDLKAGRFDEGKSRLDSVGERYRDHPEQLILVIRHW